ncbi:MAG: 50S ribosomal protein L25 [bacterium]|nr:50S ribosomal protein L25 [bacterium]MDZ4231889.1 50S ribosomal protein L25 [Candidatus Pacearchaeota archaeon]
MIGITAEKRAAEAKAGVLRKRGITPGVVYGPSREVQSLSVVSKELDHLYREAGESSLISLEIDGASTPVLIRDIQKDPVLGSILHVDFYQPPLDKKIRINVQLVFEGEAPGVKEFGGTLLRTMHEVEVEALPQDLPHEILCSLEGLKTFEDRLLVGSIVVPQGVEILAEPDEVIAQVVPAEDVEADLAASVEEAAVPEEVKEEKKEEEKEGEEAKAKEE